MRTFLPLAALSTLLAPASAPAAVVLESPEAHAEALSSQPGAGLPLTQTFEGLPVGAALSTQLAGYGLGFASAAPTVILPEAFGTSGRGARLAVTGFAPQTGAALTIRFEEPQRTVAGYFVDLASPLVATTWLEGELVETFELPAEGEGVAGGVFRAMWFAGQADALTLLGGAAEDGFGIDDLQVAAFGTVDNDGDGVSELGGDCDDGDASVGPGALDDCDGVDSDCDGVVDDADDADGDGVALCAGDCDDSNAAVAPGFAEVCDGLDNDCDGVADGLPDLDGDGFGPCDGDCGEGDGSVSPGATEICDGLDNDCDGLVDESADFDGDGYTVCEGDCDDGDADVFPGQGCGPADGDDDDTSDDDTGDDDTGDDDTGDGAGDDDTGDDDDTSLPEESLTPAIPGIAGGGCGCATSGSGTPGLALFALLLLFPRRRRGPLGPRSLLLLPLLAPGLLWAQSLPESNLGLDTLRFRPAVTQAGGALADGVHIGGPWRFDAGLWMSYARDEVVFTADGEPTGDPVVSNRLAGVLRIGVNIGARVRVALDLPAAFAQQGVHPETGAALPVGGLGDLTLSPHVMVLDPSKLFLGVALASPITFPTGRVDALLGDPGPTIQPRVVLEKRLSWARVPLLNLVATAQAGWRFRARTALLDLDTGGEFTFAASLRWDPISRIGLGSEVVGAIGSGGNGRHAEWLGTLRLVPDRKEQFTITAGAGVGLSRGVGTPAARMFVAASFALPLARPAVQVAEQVPAPVSPSAPLPQEDGPPIASRDAGWGLRLVGRQTSIDTRLLFAFNSAELLREGRPLLDEIARWVLARESGALEVLGHADPLGSERYNEALSLARAEAVVRYLVRAGVPQERLEAKGRGEREPLPTVAAADPEQAWAPSRRVEFRWIQPDSHAVQLRTGSSPTRHRR